MYIEMDYGILLSEFEFAITFMFRLIAMEKYETL